MGEDVHDFEQNKYKTADELITVNGNSVLELI